MSKSSTNRKWTSTPESRRNWDRIFRGIDAPAECPFNVRFITANMPKWFCAVSYILRNYDRLVKGATNEQSK